MNTILIVAGVAFVAVVWGIRNRQTIERRRRIIERLEGL